MDVKKIMFHHHVKVPNPSNKLLPYILSDNLPTAEVPCKINYAGNGDYFITKEGWDSMLLVHSSNVKSAEVYADTRVKGK